jgi:3-methyladenine DNA glycosylase AlkC
MKEGNKTELLKRIEPIITWVKRHNGHVKAQEYEAERQSAPVKATDIKSAEQDFGTVIQIDPNAREDENIAQHHCRSKGDMHNSI